MANPALQYDEIQKFLTFLDPNRKEWFFQVFPGADFFKGSLKEAESFLDRHKTQDKGIYFMPNEWELEGLEIPKNEHIVRSRLLFIDVDRKHTIPEEFHVEPSLIVQTNTQGQQIYWKTDEDIPLDQYTKLQKSLIKRYGSDSAIHDERRLMRLPYTWNCKYEEPHLVTVKKANKGEHKILDVAVPEIETNEIIDLPFSDPLIENYNKEIKISDILLRNDYQQIGDRFLAPHSTSNIPGVTILDNKAYSHQDSCKLHDEKAHDAFDCMRILECGGDWSVAKKSIEVSVVPKAIPEIVTYNVHEFIALDLPPREYIIEDFMAKGDLHMIYGDVGHGKSILTHYLAQCLSAGVDFGPYKIKDPRKVLLIDGEMPAVTLQDKWKQKYDFLLEEEVFQSYGYNLETASAMVQPNGLEPFNTPIGKERFWSMVNRLNPEVVMFDNLLTLFAMEDTNRGEEWTIHVQPMLLELRKRNTSVWMCHHAGKNGTQYGTMTKTIMLDVILKIEHEIELGALGIDTTSFKWMFEKGRHIFGKSIQPIVWTYSGSNMKWDRIGKENTKDLCIELLRQGNSQKQISLETGLSTSQVSRYLRGIKVGTTI